MAHRLAASWIEPATLLLFALILAYQLLVPPIVGLASNGDYGRITDKVGLRYATMPENENQYLVRKYERQPPNDWAGYVSSEVLIVRLALLLNRFISKDGLFDLTVLGAVHAGLFLVAVGVVLWSVRALALVVRILTAGLLLLVFSDVAYIAYFNSFFSEPASLIFLLLTIGLGLALITRSQNLSPPARAGLALLFWLAAGLLVIAKPQNAPLSLPLAAVGYRLTAPALPFTSLHIRRAMAGTLALAVLVLAAIYLLRGWPARFREANLYNIVFAEILRTSPAPERDLAALGLDRDLIVYADTTAYSPGTGFTAPAVREKFFTRIGYDTIARYYLTHPDRFLHLARRGAANAFFMRPTYLGNFEASSGLPPYAQSQAFDHWSNRKPHLLPRTVPFLLLWFAASASIAAGALLFSGHGWTRRAAELHLAVIVMAALQFIVVLIGEGMYELTKHLFLFNALFDLSLGFTAISVAGALERALRGLWRKIPRVSAEYLASTVQMSLRTGRKSRAP